MTHEQFEQLVIDALSKLPNEFLEKLDNVDIVVDLEPSEYQLEKMKLRHGNILFGFYEGIPLSKRPNRNYSMVLPDKITIFQKSIERFYQEPELIKEQVRKTVAHEIGHHFGIEDDKLRQLGY